MQTTINTTGRHLVIVRYTRTIVQTAYRCEEDAQVQAKAAWLLPGVTGVETGYVANYRGRRRTVVRF
jgi:hypothetical protein